MEGDSQGSTGSLGDHTRRDLVESGCDSQFGPDHVMEVAQLAANYVGDGRFRSELAATNGADRLRNLARRTVMRRTPDSA